MSIRSLIWLSVIGRRLVQQHLWTPACCPFVLAYSVEGEQGGWVSFFRESGVSLLVCVVIARNIADGRNKSSVWQKVLFTLERAVLSFKMQSEPSWEPKRDDQTVRVVPSSVHVLAPAGSCWTCWLVKCLFIKSRVNLSTCVNWDTASESG